MKLIKVLVLAVSMVCGVQFSVSAQNPYSGFNARYDPNSTPTYPIVAVCKGDSMLNGNLRMDAGLPQTLIFKHRGKTTIISPEKTLAIVCTVNGQTRRGIPAGDSCWLFPSVIGAIIAFSPMPEPDNQYIIAIRRAGIDSPIVQFTNENLREMIADEPKALALLDKRRKFEALKMYNKLKSRR